MDEYKRRRRRSRAVMSMFLDSLGGSIDNVDVATFDSDGSDLKALVVGIEPIQDLHGYDNPWPAGGGKNKFDKSVSPVTGYVSTTGTYISHASGGEMCLVSPLIEAGTYTISKISSARFRVGLFENQPSGTDMIAIDFWTADPQTSTQLTITTTADGYLIIFCYNGASESVTIQQISDSLQIEAGSTATAWTPYSNICPITGHSSVNVIVSPTLNPLDGTITNIPLGGTYYGGTLDVLTGLLTVTHANISSYNGEAINEPWISSMDAYSPGATPTTGAQVVYPLATPQIIQLTGQQIATFVGTNHVWCDSGRIIHLEY